MKPCNSIQLTTIILASILSAQIFALGGEGNVGNGGYAYRYTNAQGIERLEMVDYWELMHTPGLEPRALPETVDPDETWIEKTHRLIEAIRSKDVELAEFLLTSLERFNSPDFYTYTDGLWGPTREPDDINAEFAPKKPSIELVVYQLREPGLTLVELFRTPVFDELSNTQKLVAFLHESIYRERKQLDPDSTITRQITQLILSGQFEKAKQLLFSGLENETSSSTQTIKSFSRPTSFTLTPRELWSTSGRQFSLLLSFWRHRYSAWKSEMARRPTNSLNYRTEFAESLLLDILSPDFTPQMIAIGETNRSYSFGSSMTPSDLDQYTNSYKSIIHFDELTFSLNTTNYELNKTLSLQLFPTLWGVVDPDNGTKAKAYCVANLVQLWLENGSTHDVDFENLSELGYSNLAHAFPLQELRVSGYSADGSGEFVVTLGNTQSDAANYMAHVKTVKAKTLVSKASQTVTCAIEEIKIEPDHSSNIMYYNPDNDSSFIYRYDNHRSFGDPDASLGKPREPYSNGRAEHATR